MDKPRFKIGDLVMTNIHYCQGWDNCPAPNDIIRIKKGEVIGVHGNGIPDGYGKDEGYNYEVKTKSTTKIINQCFLEFFL